MNINLTNICSVMVLVVSIALVFYLYNHEKNNNCIHLMEAKGK